MGVIGGEIGYRILNWLSPGSPAHMDGSAYREQSKLELLLGAGVWDAIRDRDVMDYGSGEGQEVIEMAQRGARSVTGIEIQEHLRHAATGRARDAGVEAKVRFVQSAEAAADVVVCLDSFEHFANPARELETMFKLLRPGGVLLASFGPTWYHPYGGHLFSVFPWAHLVFTEKALIRWRSNFKSDGARHFGEVAGGLNQMTLRRFDRMVNSSPFEVVRIEPVPIRKLRPIAGLITREFTTAIVRAALRKPTDGQ